MGAIKYIYDAGLFYVFCRKHFCPKCGKKLELRYNSKIVNSKSPEAKNYDFTMGDVFFVGDVCMWNSEQDIPHSRGPHNMWHW